MNHDLFWGKDGIAMPKSPLWAPATVSLRAMCSATACARPRSAKAEIALYDIDAERLEESYIIPSAINHNTNQDRATLKTYCGVENRRERLRGGADFVVNAIQVGFYEACTVIDFRIPKKYGLRQTIADTLGIGGVMRPAHDTGARGTSPATSRRSARRVVPQLHEPDGDALRLYARYTNVKTVGLYHSGTRPARATC